MNAAHERFLRGRNYCRAQARPCPSDTDPNNGVTHIDNNVKNETITFVWDSQGEDVSNVLL